MNGQSVSLERSLADLDWEGIGIPTVLANVFWVFLLFGLSSTEIMRHVRESAQAEDGSEACRRMLTMIFDVARQSGRLELLRRPRVRDREGAFSPARKGYLNVRFLTGAPRKDRQFTCVGVLATHQLLSSMTHWI